jgi:hypothetical protein
MRKLTAVLAVVALGAGASSTSAGYGPTLQVSPKTVRQGGKVTFAGSYWPANKRVQLLIGPPNSEATRFASPRTDGSGNFRVTKPINSSAPTGKYVILACRNSCATKVSRKLTIVAG